MKIWLAIKASCLVVLTLAFSSVLLEMRGLLRDVRLSVLMSDAVLGNVNDASLQTAQMAKTAGGALTAETKRLDASTRELQKTEASARLLIVRTNESLNGSPNVRGLLPATTEALGSANRLVLGVRDDMDGITKQITPSLDLLRIAADGAAADFNDPAIRNSLQHMDEATSHLAAASDSLEGIAKDGRDSADLAEARLKQLLKPASMTKTILLNLLGIGYQLRSVLGL